ncbi:MAG TPA: NUDIX domain-containing protein [Nocardia sp.]|uniref:NUDIX hydrolase n=1 Tax=Nocardia sp. TaxID=1821 RepID=UPI002B4AB881|nr:NUDIX domain-containing protein [Nocardia sp.]HLS77419.1 NUDIX domain-containing protein [Nocardia sp.]
MNVRHFVDVHVLLLRADRVLLSRRRGSDEFDRLWHLPAGKLEEGESARAGAAREAFEEVGVRVDPPDLELVHTAHVVAANRPDRVGLFFRARRWSGEPHNREPDKCYELAWFPLDALPADLIAYPAAALRGLRIGEIYSELGWPAP